MQAFRNLDQLFPAPILCGAQQRGIELTSPEEFDSIPGHGVEAKIEGAKVLLGNRKLMSDRRIEIEALARG